MVPPLVTSSGLIWAAVTTLAIPCADKQPWCPGARAPNHISAPRPGNMFRGGLFAGQGIHLLPQILVPTDEILRHGLTIENPVGAKVGKIAAHFTPCGNFPAGHIRRRHPRPGRGYWYAAFRADAIAACRAVHGAPWSRLTVRDSSRRGLRRKARTKSS